MKIKVKYYNPICKIENNKKGEWFDLKADHDISLCGPFANTLNGKRDKRDVEFDGSIISLGFAMQLPKEFEAHLVPRSSTYKKWGIIQSNHVGIIDSSYCGDNDIWGMPVIALRDTTIDEGDRICQFRIMPSQKASVWTKIKWLFTRKIAFVEVDSLNNKDRGGFGSTGKN